MALVNHAKKEINAKIVYFGAAGTGKSTVLSYVYSRVKPSLRGELKNIPAGSDNLLFFDFSPFEVPLPNGYHLRLHVYTLTGAVTNPATWKMTLKGADGIMIVVNPAINQESVAKESIAVLRNFLSAYGVGLHETPAVLQLNCFTGDNSSNITAQNLDLADLQSCSTNAASGEGLIEALTLLSKQVLEKIMAEYDSDSDSDSAEMDISTDNSSLEEFLEPHEYEESVATDVTLLPEQSMFIDSVQHEIILEEQVVRIPLKFNDGQAERTLVVTINLKLE